ncbi:MAG TPA: S8 family serine peptidase [Blastocatellia bacterium]|nr:S8 family serine peptidase [Blastocatellia bacterium]
MRWSNSQKVKLSIMAYGVALLLLVALAGSPATVVSSDDFRNPSLILLKRGAIDTEKSRELDTSIEDALLSSVSLARHTGFAKQTRIIQFRGPIKRRWVEQVMATGSEIIGYIPNNAYIIRGTARELAEVALLDGQASADEVRPVQWMGRLLPSYKIDPAYEDRLLTQGGATSVDVEIELLDTQDSIAAIERINALAPAVNRAPRRFLDFVVLSVTLPSEALLEIASYDEVMFIGPAFSPVLDDERSAQIVAANLNPAGAAPLGPGYREWLQSKGLDFRADFLIDFSDTGLDRGATGDFFVHPDFLDDEGRSRVLYNINYAQDQNEDRRGHGTLVASIACGLGAADRKDEAGYMYGLGIDPAARLGMSRIFAQNGRFGFQLSFTTVASTAYAAGARISNNSWGDRSNSYDAAAQEFDALVRDAQPATPGNQEMVYVFSAGNGGPGGFISSPGTAKNVITVAASENFRPAGFDSCDLDGGGAIGPEGADSVLDILRFSSGGPTSDLRAKPDITAPGTHIFGAASQAPFFTAAGLCPGTPIYQPPGQRFYTWSSGTSMAAPHVSGAASLLRKFFTLRGRTAPSPAMTRAYLINSASYLTGENAGGDLPADRQGWGLVNLARALDDTDRIIIDQTKLFTESGQTHEIEGAIADRSQPLRVTLCWTDAPGSLAGAALVNDLDIEITVGQTTVYRGNVLAGNATIEGGEPDRFNNVESIYLPADAIPEGEAGNFKITVRAANIAGDGVPGNGDLLDQDFALVISNITAPVVGPPPPPPPVVPVITSVTYVKKKLTITGRDFTAAARVEINGQIIDRVFKFDAASNFLRIKLKARKLNLQPGEDNQIVVIEENRRSLPFILKL